MPEIKLKTATPQKNVGAYIYHLDTDRIGIITDKLEVQKVKLLDITWLGDSVNVTGQVPSQEVEALPLNSIITITI